MGSPSGGLFLSSPANSSFVHRAARVVSDPIAPGTHVVSCQCGTKGFIMETEHTEGIVEKAVAYVKDMFGTPPYHRHVDSEGRPIMPPTDGELAAEENKRKSPSAYTFRSVAEVNPESVRREDGE